MLEVGSYSVGFVVGHYIIDFDCFLLNFVGFYLGASYSNSFLADFVD